MRDYLLSLSDPDVVNSGVVGIFRRKRHTAAQAGAAAGPDRKAPAPDEPDTEEHPDVLEVAEPTPAKAKVRSRAAEDSKITEVAGTLIGDRCWDDLALDTGVDVVREGQLRAGTALLRESRADYDIRAQRVVALGRAAIGQSKDVSRLFTEQLDRADAADVLLWLGATIIAEAAEIRGRGIDVSDDRSRLFRATLQEASDPLLAAAKLAPQDPVPWSLLQSHATGLGRDRAHRDATWRKVIERYPTLFHGHTRRLQSLTVKWGGTHDEMFEFAAESVRSAPAGHPLTAMLPAAHAEYLAYEQLLQWRGGQRLLEPIPQHFTEPVTAELVAAETKWRSAARPRPDTRWAHSLFAWAMLRAGDEERAVWHLSRVGDRPSAVPWSYESTTIRAFAGALVALGMTIAEK